MALYSFNQQTQTGTFGIFTVNIAPATGQITLTTWGSPGDAVLPTTANYLAYFVNTTGAISSAAGNVTQPGNISAGLSGTAGTVASFPATAANGSLILAAANAGGAFNTTISTAGVTVDSGVATTNVQLMTQVKAATTANIGGAGAGPITVTVAGVNSASVIVASIATSSNTVAVGKVTPGRGDFSVTFTADPGATCTLSYIAYIAPQ
jgi:hypothetical protein